MEFKVTDYEKKNRKAAETASSATCLAPDLNYIRPAVKLQLKLSYTEHPLS